MFKKNEYKVSIMRNFGTEQISFTGTVHSRTLNPESILNSVMSAFGKAVEQTFQNTVYRHDAENAFIAEVNKEKEAKVKAIKDKHK